MGDAAQFIDPHLVREAAAAVVHYFKTELKRDSVSVQEFAQALEKVLNHLGFEVISTEDNPGQEQRIARSDLRTLATSCDKAFELLFFPRLRAEVKLQLSQSPRIVRFEGLRSCVKQLIGAQRWNDRCQTLNDQIVEYLRECFTAEATTQECGLLVL
ncbi:MAG: hypothetical protein SFY81_01880 [Verrucomicrobiota bacterium]|nr:hypothetical protein [Verrucomicrobiota bacterium]